MTKLPENEEWMFHMIQEINHYYIIDTIYIIMIYIIEEMMKKGLIDTIEPKITFTLHLDERDCKRSLIGIEYPTDYNEEPYTEEERNIAGWKCPKECCYNTIIFNKKPESKCCKKALDNFQKMRKKMLEDKKHRDNIEKIVKGRVISTISSEHMFDIHEELKQYSERIKVVKLEGEQLFFYKVSLYVVEKWLRSEANWIDFVNFDAEAHGSPLPWEEELSEKELAIAKIFHEYVEENLYNYAKKNNLKWFTNVWDIFEKYLREVEGIEFVKEKHYPTKTQ